jgi:hypothetical protein
MARLMQAERRSRWEGDGLSDDTLRQWATFAQAFNEMAQGDEFVRRALVARARERQRWRVAPVVLAACLAFVALHVRRRRRVAASVRCTPCITTSSI